MKCSTQLRRMVEGLFHLLVLSRCLLKLCFWKYISFRCFFYIFLVCRCSLRFLFALHFLLFVLFITCPWTKKKNVESLTKNITFPTVHPSAMEIPAKNTIGLSIKKSNFCFRCKRKTLISPPMFTLFHFFCSSKKNHTKDLLLAKNQNSNKIFRLTITGNLKMVVISFVCLLPVRPSALQHGGFVPREWLAAEGPLRSIIFWEIALLPLAANPTFFLSRTLVLTLG